MYTSGTIFFKKGSCFNVNPFFLAIRYNRLMDVDDLGDIQETRNVEELSVYEKSDIARQVASRVELVKDTGASPFILIRGGPGVGKSTACYESLDYLRSKGFSSVEIQPDELGSERTRNRIKDMNPNQILFVDSLDAALSAQSSIDGLSETIKLLKELKATGNSPVVLVNIHDPYLVKKGLEATHSEKRNLLLGSNGLFDNPSSFIEVKDECSDDTSLNMAVTKFSNEGGVHASWTPFLQQELKAQGINQHSIISNLFSDVSLAMNQEQLLGEFVQQYGTESEEKARTWLKQMAGKVKEQNNNFRRAYFEPNHPDEAYKGLVRHNVMS